MGRTFWAKTSRVAASAAMPTGLAVFCHRLPHVDTTTAALGLLLVVLGTATAWGMLEAVTAAIAGGLALDYYFLPPFGLKIAAFEDWMVLFVFLAAAVTTGELSVRAKRRAAEAEEQRREVEKLYALGRALLQGDSFESTARCVVEHLVQALGFEAAMLYHRAEGRIFRAGASAVAISDEELRETANLGCARLDPLSRTALVPIQWEGRTIGSLAVCGAGFSENALLAMAERVAVGLERARALEESGKAEAARKAQELKSTLLDALAHEIKTPLTAIKVAVTSLLSESAEPQRELLAIINEETDRLDELTEEAIQTARLEAGMLRLERGPREVRGAIQSTLKELEARLEQRPVEVALPDSLPPADMDARMIRQVLKLLLDNALKYSPPGSSLAVSSELLDGAIVIRVSNSGAGIPEDEQARIFEKYYRGREKRADVPGMGMGLAMARSIVEAHGGSIGVTSRPGQGSVFHISLPVWRASVP